MRPSPNRVHRPLSRARRAWNTLGDVVGKAIFAVLLLSALAWAGDLHLPWTAPARFAAGVVFAGLAYVGVSGVVYLCAGKKAQKAKRGLLVLVSALIEAIGYVALCHLGHADWFGPDAIGLGFDVGVRMGFVWLAATAIREEHEDIVGKPWPAFELRDADIVDALFGKPLGTPAQHLLERTQPRWLRTRGITVVDISGVEFNPWLAAKWVIPSPTGGPPARQRTVRRMLWLLALSLGIAESKRRVTRVIDEASAVRMLLRELSDAEWAWVQRGWCAMDREADVDWVLAMEPWEWIDRLPHSERSLQGWQDHWDENLRVDMERWSAEEEVEEQDAPRPALTPRPTPPKRRQPTDEEQAALRERLQNKVTLHQL